MCGPTLIAITLAGAWACWQILPEIQFVSRLTSPQPHAKPLAPSGERSAKRGIPTAGCRCRAGCRCPCSSCNGRSPGAELRPPKRSRSASPRSAQDTRWESTPPGGIFGRATREPVYGEWRALQIGHRCSIRSRVGAAIRSASASSTGAYVSVAIGLDVRWRIRRWTVGQWRRTVTAAPQVHVRCRLTRNDSLRSRPAAGRSREPRPRAVHCLSEEVARQVTPLRSRRERAGVS